MTELIQSNALQHWNTNIYVRADGENTAVGRCYMMAAIASEAPVIGQAGAQVERLGRYSDRLVKLEGKWRFAEKIYENYFVDSPKFATYQPWDRAEA